MVLDWWSRDSCVELLACNVKVSTAVREACCSAQGNEMRRREECVFSGSFPNLYELVCVYTGTELCVYRHIHLEELCVCAGTHGYERALE